MADQIDEQLATVNRLVSTQAKWLACISLMVELMSQASQDLTDANARLAAAIAAYRAAEKTDKQALTDANTAETQLVTDLTAKNTDLQATIDAMQKTIDAGGAVNLADLQTHLNETQAMIDSFTPVALPDPPVVPPVVSST
jgi:hypothetical protein